LRTVIIGLSYGDEGKGRVSAHFTKDYDWSVRFNGANNAGHTAYKDGKAFKLHHLPAGALFGKKVALDTGMAISLRGLVAELDELKLAGIEVDLHISQNIHLITQEHCRLDGDGSSIGTTKKGVGPCYADRAARKGWRIEELRLLDTGGMIYKGLPPIQEGESVLFESAQGIMLDVDYGCYPYVTSSSIMPSMVHKIDKVIGVMKAYTTRVGDGPPYRPQILELTEMGKEYGTTTGRPRKCYWNDLRELDYAISIVQPDEIVVTKMDILTTVKPCIYDREGTLLEFSNTSEYSDFLVENISQIKWVSYSPDGEMVRVNG